MTLYRSFLWFWLTGLVLFAIVLALHAPLILTEVPGGIVDHQTAGSAAEVNRIQLQWQAAGLWQQPALAMIGDLIFIGTYGLGSVLGGLHFRRSGTGFLRALGTLIAIAGLIFIVTDYLETIAQFIQLIRFAGDNNLAGLAATVQPAKMVACAATFLGMLLALATDYRQSRTP